MHRVAGVHRYLPGVCSESEKMKQIKCDIAAIKSGRLVAEDVVRRFNPA